MVTHSNTPLRASQRKDLQRQKLKRQVRLSSTMLLCIILITWLIDASVLNSKLLITQGITLGAFINWLAQSIFAGLVFRYTGAQAKHSIVGQMYLGQIIKWVVVISGFGLVFFAIKPISAGAVIFGFIAMQMGHFISLWKFR
ncbi:ATP synthase subunit I [Psychrobacter lutiphocae]|uniref:ATP synthase subunit I n=1 Tax=Psychrobacter lutiphocae TaxID=540500 RepID=UPI001D10BABC|nr:ATP synthase subunit I [Psychrobacter lutiphocae]